MKLSEFIEAMKRYQQRQRAVALIVMAMLITLTFAYLLFLSLIGHGLRREIGGTAAEWVEIALMVLLYAGFMYWFGIRQRRIERECGPECPQCGKRFPLQLCGKVIASKGCPFCQGRVIDEEGLAAKRGQALGVIEFKIAAKRYERRMIINVLAPLAIMALIGGEMVFLMKSWVGPNLDVNGLIVMDAPPVLLAGILVWWCRGWERRLNRRWGVDCPCCGENIAKAGAMVVATGYCPNCGGHVFEEDAARA